MMEYQKIRDSVKGALKLIDDIWRVTKAGEVIRLNFIGATSTEVSCLFYNRRFFFKLEELGVNYFITKGEAQQKAAEYLAEVTKYVSKSKLKRISSLKEGDRIWVKSKIGVSEAYLSTSHYDKNSLALIEEWEIDDDYGGRYDDAVYPLSEYGKTWALTKEELE